MGGPEVFPFQVDVKLMSTRKTFEFRCRSTTERTAWLEGIDINRIALEQQALSPRFRLTPQMLSPRSKPVIRYRDSSFLDAAAEDNVDDLAAFEDNFNSQPEWRPDAVIKKGVLMQKNDSGEWESKHVELDAKMLTCYATLTLMSMKEDGQGVLLSKLKAVRVLEAVSDGAGPEVFPFQVDVKLMSTRKTFEFRCRSTTERTAWLEGIDINRIALEQQALSPRFRLTPQMLSPRSKPVIRYRDVSFLDAAAED